MKSRTVIWLPAIIASLLTSCSWLNREKPDDSTDQPKSDVPTLVGRIASVPADKRFVLIQSYEKWNIETGSILTTRGLDNRTANLRVTGESLGQFAAADLQSGIVEVGDAVYSRHVPKPVDVTTEPDPNLETPENQANPNEENVQKNN